MEVRSGYKQTDAGVLPQDWLDAQLHEITDESSPICYGIVQVGPNVAGGIPVLAIKDLNRDYSNSIHHASPSIERPYLRSRTRPDDVLISVKGTIGRVGIVPAHFSGNISRDLARIRPRNEISPRFLCQMLQSDIAQHRLVAATVGTTRMELSIGVLKQIRIPLPPTRAEQEAIADVLSDAEALVGSLGQLLAKKRLIRRGSMQALLTCRRRLPGHCGAWVVKRLDELAEVRSGGTPSTARDEYWDGNIPWCTPTDITALDGYKYLDATNRSISTLGLESSSAELVPANSVVMTSRATIGECAISLVPVCTNQGFKSFVPRESVDAEFLYYLLVMQRPGFMRLCGGSTFLEIGKRQISSFEVRIPPTETEQVDISATLSDMDAEIAALEAKLAKTRRIQQGMMQQLLTGRTRLV